MLANVIKGHQREECNPEKRMKGIVYSLFGAITVLNKMRVQSSTTYNFDYVLEGGTLLAFQRHSAIFPWDTDADIYLLFEQNPTDNQLISFKDEFQTEIDHMFEPQYQCEVRWWMGTVEKPRKYFAIQVHFYANGSWLGFTDVFMLFINGNGTKFINYRGDVAKRYDEEFDLSEVEVDWILPIQRNQNWAIYDNFEVNLPNQPLKFMEFLYGTEDWKTPDVEQRLIDCPKVNKSTIEQWINDIRSRQTVQDLGLEKQRKLEMRATKWKLMLLSPVIMANIVMVIHLMRIYKS